MVQFPISTVLRRRTLRTLASVVLVTVLALGSTPSSVSAASSSAPTLLVNTEAFQRIDSGNGTSNIELQFGSSTQTIKFLYTLQKFQFSHAISVLGTISGSSLNVDRNATVGGTLTVTGAITGVSTITAKTILSGSTLRVSAGGADIHGPLAVTGSIRSDSDITINDDAGAVDAVFTFGNASGNQTLKFLNTLQKFQFSKSISVIGTISGSSLNVDRNATVGGTLTVTGAITGVSTITAKTVLSGNTLVISNSAKVGGTLSASGTLALEGHLTGATIAGFGLASCNGASQKIIYNSGTGKFECGTDLDTDTNTTYTAGQGLTLNGTSFRLSDSFSGTTVKVLGSLSGANIHAEQTLTSSGTLTADGIIRTKSNLTINSDSDTNDAVFTFGNQSGDQTLKFLNTLQKFQFSKGISVIGTISGSSLNVDQNATIGGTLSASGTLALEGHLTGATIAGFGLKSCNAGGQTLQWNSSTNKFECGSASVGNGSGGILSLHPEYPNAIFFGSGTALQTVGQLSASGSVSLNENFYHWQTTQAGIQDYWISVRVRLPDNFSTWDPIKPIELRYRTADATASNNHVSMRIRDTGGTERTLTGASGIASATFATAEITGPESAGTWTPKGYITVYIKLAALTGKFAEVGYINFNFESTTP